MFVYLAVIIFSWHACWMPLAMGFGLYISWLHFKDWREIRRTHKTIDREYEELMWQERRR